MASGAAKVDDERFGEPGGSDPGEATSSAANASHMRERASQELNPEMCRMGAEDPAAILHSVAKARFWATISSLIPLKASASIESSSGRVYGAPSAVA